MIDNDLPYSIINASSLHPFILLAEHAGSEFPESYKFTDFPHNGSFEDRGVSYITSAIAETCGTTAIMGRYSRLLINLNRVESDPDLIPTAIHNVPILENGGLSKDEIQRRIALFHRPFYQEINYQIERRNAAGVVPILCSINTFNPSSSKARLLAKDGVVPEMGFVFMNPNETVLVMRELLHKQKVVQDDYPYSLQNGREVCVRFYSRTHNLAVIAIEISSLSEPAQAQWIDCLSTCINSSCQRDERPSFHAVENSRFVF